MESFKLKLLPALIATALLGANPASAEVKISSDDGKFSTTIGGRIQVDAWAVDKDDYEDIEGKSGTEFRRARIFVKGTMYDNWSYKAQYD
ncbi:MAG: porin, partial [Gammaproteobacteria bacterium]